MSLPQTAIDVLIDLYMPLPTGLRRELADAPEALLRWQPDPEANSIAITVWHIGRLLDLLCARLLQGQTAQEERWFVDGYATQTGYDPLSDQCSDLCLCVLSVKPVSQSTLYLPLAVRLVYALRNTFYVLRITPHDQRRSYELRQFRLCRCQSQPIGSRHGAAWPR